MPLHSLPPPSKKRKVQTDAEVVKSLETKITAAVAANGSLNALADLLAVLLELQDPHDCSKAIYALYRVFVTIISNGNITRDGDDSFLRVKSWILEHLNTYVGFLGGLLQDDEKFLRISALQILFSLLKHLSTAYTKSSPQNRPQIHAAHFRKIISYLLLCPPSQRSTSDHNQPLLKPDVLDTFYEIWFSVYDDIRWFFLRDTVSLLRDDKSHFLPANVLSVLERLTTFPTTPTELNAWWITEFADPPSNVPDPESIQNDDSQPNVDDDWRTFFENEPAPETKTSTKTKQARLHQMTLHQSLHSLSSHTAVFTRCWLTLLPRLSSHQSTEERNALITRTLNVMHRCVLPHLTRPILTMDWVGGCVDIGGSVGLLALNALFTLIKDYNLDYPSFYTRLYAYLDRDVLHLRHRARFFRLMDLFLNSTHIPAALLASFVKRLSRLSLFAPPAAIVLLIPFIYNILKRHPSLMVMIHCDEIVSETQDPFLPDEIDPMRTHALESSLWELATHVNHYHAPISSLSKIFTEAFTKPGYAMEDFLDHTYTTLFDTDVNRKIKKEPALELQLNTSPFLSRAVEGEGNELSQAQDPIAELWAF